jgi:parallel beta-helix repeat protein
MIYYWAIDEVSYSGPNPGIWQGDVWSFTTKPAPIFVDVDATGANDGSSWADAYNSLQDGLARANSSVKPVEIRVAQGIYRPGPPGPPEPPIPPPPPPLPTKSSNSQRVEVIFADREATFMLKNGVAIKGGYAGAGEPDPNARDIELYESILSGDLNGNDGDENDSLYLLVDPCRAENSYHVVTGSGTDESAVLDGFTITASNANGSWSDRTNFGGGMFNVSGSPTITNCTFTKNLARDGGGMCNYDYSNPMLTNCTFRANLADRDGGGIANIYHSSPTLTNCTFSGNSARYGGGMDNIRSSPTLTDCAFSGNSASSNGGGISNWFYSGPIVSNCTFSENSAGSGGGFFCEYAPPPPVAGIANGRIGENPDTPVFYNSGGTNITMANCDTIGNSHGDHAGGMDDFGNHPMLTNCTFTANSANMGNGGGIYSSYGNPTLLNCVFSGNSAEYDGGGMSNFSSSPTLTNCTFSGNCADSGGGMYNTGGGLHGPSTSSPTLINCTFAENQSMSGRALACGSCDGLFPSKVQIANCILWDGGDEIRNYDGSTIKVYYSDVWDGFLGEGNIDSDPLFVEPGYWGDRDDPNIVVEPNDPNALWVYGDYHLLGGSPCIDAGDPNYVSEPNETDLDGRPRVIGGRIDMGAYEFFNTPPVSDAGDDQVVECACNTPEGTKVTLDGSGSYDVDGDALTYSWTGPFIESPAEGAAPTVTLEDGCPGEYVIALVVNDGTEDSEPNEVKITVDDTTPPEFTLAVSPTALWPPNKKMVMITPSWTVSDNCDATPDVSLVSVSMNESETRSNAHTGDDIQVGQDGTIYVRAERNRTGDRIYTITYQAVDDSGNAAVRSATVTVPRKRR